DLLTVDVDSAAIESLPVTVPAYWLALCLDNLIRNALQHGRAPITLRVQLSAQRLLLTVEDAGEGTPRAISSTTTSHASGMGIGLFLVRRMMQRAGGRLRVQRRPTRYTLELPR
ncbi:MAG: sensor histidine kinase, partial [Plesiomonas shigelloides]